MFMTCAFRGAGMLALAPWISEEIHGEGSKQWRTMVHGDYKAMNIFVPADASVEPGGHAALIDFQWTGVGLGSKFSFIYMSYAMLTSSAHDPRPIIAQSSPDPHPILT